MIQQDLLLNFGKNMFRKRLNWNGRIKSMNILYDIESNNYIENIIGRF